MFNFPIGFPPYFCYSALPNENGPWRLRGMIFCTFPNFDNDHIFPHEIQTFPNILIVLKSPLLVELFQVIFSIIKRQRQRNPDSS